MSALTSTVDSPSLDRLNAAFLTVLPRIEIYARCRFRHLRCSHQRDDSVAEVVAIALSGFRSLAARGRDGTPFALRLADFAVRDVANGRRLCGWDRADALAAARRRNEDGAVAQPFPEDLPDTRLTPVPDQAAFRCDFAAWLGTLRDRDRHVAEELSAGAGPREVGHLFGISKARVGQLRQAFHRSWLRFTA
jgi:hypothetical protein